MGWLWRSAVGIWDCDGVWNLLIFEVMWIVWGLVAVVFVVGFVAFLYACGGTVYLVEGSFAAYGDGTWCDGLGVDDEFVCVLLLCYCFGEDVSLMLLVCNIGGWVVKLVGVLVLGCGLMFVLRLVCFKLMFDELDVIVFGFEVLLFVGKEVVVVLIGCFIGCGDYEVGFEMFD